MKLMSAILVGGALAGLADIVYVSVHYNLVYGTPPERILHSVAAGLLGPEAARAGGWGTAALGLAAHFAIAIIMATVFNVAAQFIKPLRKLWFVTGPLYGLGLMFVMNLVVVPMSAVRGPGNLPEGQFLYGAIFAHMILVGLVIAFFASRVNDRAAADLTKP